MTVAAAGSRLLVLLTISVGPWTPPGQAPALSDLLSVAASRAASLADPTRLLACDEHYRQKLDRMHAIVGFESGSPTGARNEVSAVGVDSREWRAELVLAATPGNQAGGFPWMEFRDVIEVNGKPVRDGRSRLAFLASEPLDTAGAQAVAVSQDAAAFLFGRLARAIDVPRAAVLFLHPANQSRVQFTKGGTRRIDGVQTIEVRFKETGRPTIIRGSGDRDAPSSGSFWIDPRTGNVLMSILKSPDSSTVFDELTITYREEPATGLWLPAQLKERIVDDDAGLRVEATATFTNWRVVTLKRTPTDD